MSTTLHWPCPHGCLNWCRTDGSLTNHHPRCEYVDESLIQAYRVSLPGDIFGCIVDDENTAKEMAGEDPDAPLEITPIKIHREIYEHLPEFAGF